MSSKCPSSQILQKWIQGDLSDADADSVLDHLETCPDCDKSLTSLPPLQAIDGLKQRQSGGYSDEAACRDLINHLALQPPTPTDSAPSKPTLTRIRDYEVLEVLGQGGMGVVHRARHERLNKEVAIKLLADQATAHRQLVRRFEREMQAVGELDHPNIVRALDAGEIDGRHFLVMELLKGVDLSQLLKTRGSLSVANVCELVRQAAIGLQYAHDKGLIHRDIKPSNLMLTRDSLGAPVVKVMDLGLALVSVGTTSELSLNGQLMGTPQFMAPEQAISSDVDNRADVYSLGATLYKLLTGSNPFRDLGTVQLLQKLTTTTPPSVATLRNDLPVEVVELTDRLLATDPNDRAITMGEVAETLQPFAAGHDLEPLFADIKTCGTRVAIPQVEKETAGPVVTPEIGTRVSAAKNPMKRGPRWLATGGLGGLITLSVAMGFMWLKLTDGSYLEIDADPSVDVTVTLVKDGTEVDTFQVTKDNGRLWYKSGQYKIQLPADVQDKLTIEPNSFTMTRGAQPVVRIRKVNENNDRSNPVTVVDATPVDETPVEEKPVDDASRQPVPGGQAVLRLSPDADPRTFAKWLIGRKSNLRANGVWAQKLSDLPNEEIRPGPIVASRLTASEMRELVNWMNRHAAWGSLYVENVALTDEYASALSQLTDVNSLWLGKSPISDSGIRELASSLQVTFLSLNPSELTIAGWREFQQTQTKLQNLTVHGPSLAADAVSVIAKIRSLKAVVFWGTMPISEDLVTSLSGSSIETLNIRGENPLPTKFGAQLHGLRHLTTLTVQNPHFSDQHLAQFNLPPKLKSIELKKTSVTANGAMKFKLRHPQVELIVDGGKTRLIDGGNTLLKPDVDEKRTAAGANPTVSANPAITWPSGPPDFDLLTRRAAAFEKLGQWQRATADWAQASREETDAAFQRFKSPGAVAWDLTLAHGTTHPTKIEDGVIEFGTAVDTDQPVQIMISQSELQLEDGATYYLRCKMKSGDGCRVYVGGVGLKRPRKSQAVPLTAEYQDFDFTFAPDDNHDSQSKVRFLIGQATPGKVFLKDLVFMKVPARFTMNAATAVETDAIDASRVTDPEVCFSIAESYFRDQQWQHAIDCYTNLIAPETTDVVLLAKRAEAYEKLQEWDKAAADWARASRQQTDIAFQRFKAPDDKLWEQFGTKQYSGFLSFTDGVVEFGKASATKNVHDFRIVQPKLQLKNGETYSLRFQMRSPDNGSVRIQVKRRGAIDNVWLNETFQPPSEFKDYSFTFVARDIDQHASINFASSTEPGRIVMRDIVLMKITDAVSNGEGLKAADHVDSGERESSVQTDTMPIPTAREAVERVLSKEARAVVMVDGKRVTVDGTSQIPYVPFEFRGIIGKNGNQLNDDDCRYLARLSTIDQLGLVSSKVSKEGFKEFRGKGRRKIRWLSIPRALPESHSIAAMFPNLKYVSPAYPEIVPFTKSIRGNSRIVALRLYRSQLPPEACENLAAMPNLIFLDATDSAFTRDELRLLSKSSSIRHISMTLRNGLKASDLAPLADLKTLKTIEIYGPSRGLGEHQFAEEIKALLPGCEYITDTHKHNQIRDELVFKPSLEGTPVPDLEPDADGQTLAKWLIAQNGQIGFRHQHVSRLEDVPSTPFKVNSVLLDPYSDDHAQQLVAWVATHPDCELLILRHHRLSRSTLAAISKVQHLQSLALGEAEPLEDDELLELKKMPSLKRLDLCTERLTQQGWDHIRNMGLNELLVRAPMVPMEAMETIVDIKTLKTLTLSKSPVTREMLEPLQRSSINTFSVRSSAPVDEDIGAALALIPDLQKVGFNTPSFTDVHLLGITGPPSLRFINIPPSSHKLQITAEGVREFVERHPKIELTDRAMKLLEP